MMTTKLAIIGHAKEKFNEQTAATAQTIIEMLLKERPLVISGRSPLGGIDVWAEEMAKAQGLETDIKAPEAYGWEFFRKRNLAIAEAADEVAVIAVKEYPLGFKPLRYEKCYHCMTRPEMTLKHRKGGACWTAWKAHDLGKRVTWYVIDGTTWEKLVVEPGDILPPSKMGGFQRKT